MRCRDAPPSGNDAEVVRTANGWGPLPPGTSASGGPIGPIVIVVDTSVEPTGDIVTPLVRALDDPTVGVAGGFGIVSDDLRKFEDAPPGDVTAVEGYAIAFRRADAIERGPIDERFRFYRNLDIWWSLVLRDDGDGSPPRRAVAVAIPATRHEHRGWSAVSEGERDRLSKRNFYRIIDRFGWRRDLRREADGRQRRATSLDRLAVGPVGDDPAGVCQLRAKPVGRRVVAGGSGGGRALSRSAAMSPGTLAAPGSGADRSRSSPSTKSASRTSQRRSSGGRPARSVSRTTASAVGRSRSSSRAATNRSCSVRPAADSGAAGT